MVLTLAIGIGATTAIFSVINAVLIQPLPYAESDRLIEILHSHSGLGGDETPASPAAYLTYREHNETFDSIALWVSTTQSVTGVGEPEEVESLRATHELLPTLSVQPAVGRAFTAADDEPGAPGTVMLSYAYSQRLFGSAEAAIGETLIVDGDAHEVIGVLPRSFQFPEKAPDIMTAFQPNPAIAVAGLFGERGLARLKDGVTLEQADADVARMIPIMMDTFPILPALRETIEASELRPNLKLLKERVVGDLDEILWVLMGTIGMLLLVACASVANLQLVRTESRGRELAIKTALGAGWRTITVDLMLECLVLGAVGGALGIALAWLALPVLLTMAAEHVPSVFEITIDRTVVGFALLVSLICGLLFGSLPALKHATPRPAVIHEDGRSQSLSRQRHRVRNTLVVAQVSLALMLLVASGLMIRTFESLRNVDPGFRDPGKIQTVSITIPPATAPDFGRVTRMFNDIQDRLSQIPGVQSAGFISDLPLTGGPGGPFLVEDNPAPSGAAAPSRAFRFPSPGLFATLGTPLVAGRDFRWTDNYGDQPVAIVSERMARAEWGEPSAALGRRIRMTGGDPWHEIVGVVGDLHHDGLEQPARDAVYLTLNDRLAPYTARNVSFVIRSERVGTPGFLEDIQSAIWSVDGALPLAGVRTMGDLYKQSMARTSLTLMLLSITGGMALLLGLVGIYGVISYVITRRGREIGIRVALGAQTGQLKSMFLRQCLVLVGMGVALGLGGAAFLTRLMQSQLFGVSTLDPATYAVVTAILVATAMLAAYLPVRHVTRVDPTDALRAE